MAEVTLELIKKLRGKTNVGMMNCKGALKEADGDLEAAEIILRKKGMAAADKKASRETTEGLVATLISDDAKSGVMIDVSCETDFLSKNDDFRDFVGDLLKYAADADAVDSLEAYLAITPAAAESVEDIVKAKVGSMGENMGVGNVVRYNLVGNGIISSYIHMDGKIGVLLELGCESAVAETSEALPGLAKDICLHIAASNPICLSRDEVPADVVEKEKDVYRDQVKGKPENIIDKIVEGKLDKFYSGSCLLEQGFIKDPEQTVKALLESSSADLGGQLEIRRFARFAVGEAS